MIRPARASNPDSPITDLTNSATGAGHGTDLVVKKSRKIFASIFPKMKKIAIFHQYLALSQKRYKIWLLLQWNMAQCSTTAYYIHNIKQEVVVIP